MNYRLIMKNTMKKYALAFLAFGLTSAAASAQNQETIQLNGYTIGYDSKTACGCFFTDKEMVEQGVAADISAKTNKSCSSAKYGLGASICFERIPADADYKIPAENTLISAQGYWTVRAGVQTFIVTSFEPFF